MREIPSYVLITPARNEADFIELTLKSVAGQTVRPVKWVIVDDGSIDGTGDIVKKYAEAYPWIERVKMPERRERHFGGKAAAVNAGRERIADLHYEIIGNLDADVSFEPDYFEFLMRRFSENPRLGVAGTAFCERNVSYNYEFVGLEHVSGMCQMFRRECFEELGGYQNIRSGGIDLIAVLSARAKGWETRTFVEKTFMHHRSQGGAVHAGFRERIHMGRKDYLLGSHPVWEMFRCIYQMGRKPYIVGGFLVLCSYIWSWLSGVKRTIPDELMTLRRREQIARLKGIVQRRFPIVSPTKLDSRPAMAIDTKAADPRFDVTCRSTFEGPNTAVPDDFIIGQDDLILITGACGFVGSRVVRRLVNLGFRNLRCFTRPSSSTTRVEALNAIRTEGIRIEVVKGNLQSPQDCQSAADGVSVIFHLAAGRGEKSYPDAFINSVVTTRNLLEASVSRGCLKRFVNISSFSVYSNQGKREGRLLDESCPIEEVPAARGEAYCFAKVEQDEIVKAYGKQFGIPYVIVRPGQVYGPGNEGITGRVGIGTFGIFLHMGGSNAIPLTYVDNCADAIALAGLKRGVEGQTFNVVDDDLPSSRKFLRLYKEHVEDFRSLYVPHALSYMLCYLWEKYSEWSNEQLPPAFNRRRWHAYWKRTEYSNEKLKDQLGWMPKVRTEDGLQLFFESCRNRRVSA